MRICGLEYYLSFLFGCLFPIFIVDFGTVTSNLVEGRYQSVESFSADCRLIISNCLTYYDGREDGKMYVDQANKLNECLSQQLDQLARYDKSPKATSDRLKAKEPSQFPKPPISLFVSIISDLRALKYTEKATKFSQTVMAAYEEPVSSISFPDYNQYVREKIDLQSIERKVKAGGYDMVEDFEYDVNLLFRNAETYNSRRNVQNAVAMARFGSRKFRLLLMARFRSFDDPSSMPPPRVDRQESVASNVESQPDKSISSSSSTSPGKKSKVDVQVTTKKKAAPRISIAAINSTSASSQDISPVPPNRSKSPNPKKTFTTAPAAKPKSKPNQPVPLHIAIARVKEGFPIRRAVKTLQSWEADCARYFKELMRHPWISAARPKFIFHVPVPVLFPDLCDTYAAKIKYPMDLTTIECSLVSDVIFDAITGS
jgi:Bromodomain